MSLNLIWDIKDGGVMDFGIQVPTKITFQILKETSIEKRSNLLKEYLEFIGFDTDQIEEFIESFNHLSSVPHLTLSYI